jgi:predicted metal-binding membrane protein
MAILFAVGVMNLAWITALSVFVLAWESHSARIVSDQDRQGRANGLWRLVGTIRRTLSTSIQTNYGNASPFGL